MTDKELIDRAMNGETIGGGAKQIALLVAQIRDLKTALEHYADDENWWDYETHDARLGLIVGFSQGKDAKDAASVAKQALSNLSNER